MKKEQYCLYPGRFQPPHFGHMSIFEESLKDNKKVCIAIRDVEPDEKNPLTALEVKSLWEKVYQNNPMVKVIIIPDITDIKYGRGVGYNVSEIVVSENIAKISATQIREDIQKNNDSWKNVVHESIWEDVEQLLK